MQPVGDFFRELMNSVKGTFSSQPACATQQCPDKELQAWRTKNAASIKGAIADQRSILLAKKLELEKWDNNAKESFKKAFGTLDEAARKNISGRIDRMLAINNRMTINNFKPADPSVAGVFAYVFPTDNMHTVYLDTEFHTAPRSGADSKAGVLSHEMSHFLDIGGTKDGFKDYDDGKKIYGIEASHRMAESDPGLAIQHADSFEYYVEGEH